MDAERFQQVMSLFDAACQLPQGERTAFLRLNCGSDADMQAEVQRMLEHDREPTRVLAADAAGEGMRLLAREIARTELTAGGRSRDAVESAPPTRLGRYRILRKLGEGGFGVVWLAEQENPRRTVALKVVKSHLASPQLFKRFEYEAQLLGRLQHPGIAQVFEAGTADGPHGRQAFFALEYVEGLPLDEYATQRRLDLNERLELFARVCDAVQYAHQRGVIHRDLKPANILVSDPQERSAISGATTTLIDGRSASGVAARTRSRVLAAQPKILDFGVARATDDSAEDLTSIRTSTGQLIGTLPYMSPEQVQGDPREVDTRSDVYALGVVLYRLLARRLPHDLRSCSVPEAARKIRDDAPTRLGSVDRALRGDVEVIVATALDKDKTRRYQSAADLALDLRRYLAGEPIEAKKDSALYVLRTTLRRYRGAVAVAAAFMLFVIGFAVYAGFQSRSFRLLAQAEARAAREAVDALALAQAERRRADQTAGRLVTELAVSNIERGRLLGRTGAVSTAESLIWPAHLAQPDSAHTHWALWELYAREPWRTTIQAHGTSTSIVRFTHDSRLLITAGADGRLCFWDPRDWSPVCALDAHRAAIVSLEVSPDGRRMLSSGRDGRVVLWDLSRFEPLHEFDGYFGDVSLAAFSPDGALIAIGQIDEPRIRIYDAVRGELLSALSTGTRGPAYFLFAPDGHTLAAGVRDGTIRIWEDPAHDGLERSVWRVPSGGGGRMLFSADGERLYAGGDDRVMRVWEIASNRVIATYQCPTDTIADIRAAADGRLATRGWWSVNFWNPATGAVERSVTAPDFCAAFDQSRDGRWLAIGGARGSVRVLEMQPNGFVKNFEGSDSRTAVVLSGDGTLLAAGDSRGRVRIWDTRSSRLVRDIRAHAGRVHALRFDPGGTRLATSGADRALRIWDLNTGGCLDSFGGHNARTPRGFDWSPDGKRIAFVGTDLSVHVADAAQYFEQHAFYLDASEPLSVAFSHQGDRLVTATRGGPIRVWTLEGHLERELAVDGTPWTVDFSPDDSLVAVGTWEFKVEVFDWRRDLRIAALEGHTATVWSIQFHPTDSRLIASTGSDGTVRLFDIYEQRSLLTLDEFASSESLCLSLSGDGSRLAASNSLGAVRLWDLHYFDPHIAGQIDYQLRRARSVTGALVNERAIADWQRSLRAGLGRASARDDQAAADPIR